MKKQSWKHYVLPVLLTEAIGALSGLLTRTAANTFRETTLQPPLSPPALVFPIVWTILYGLMGISAARIRSSPPSQKRNTGLNLYITQLVVNFFWSLFFFNLQAYGFSFILVLVLWILVWKMILIFKAIDPLAAKLQIPYLLWLTFAVYLSLGVWYLNR